MSELEARKNKLLVKLKPFLKDKYRIALICILLLALILRLYYINTAVQQAAWWDAADYLTSAKIVGGKLATSGGYDWTATRPIFLAIFWGTLYRLGANEFILHLTEILFAVLGTLATYLVGKELYNKKIGLIAAFIFSTFFLHLFYTFRLMSDVPAISLYFLSIYFLWKGFVKEEGNKYKILCMAFLSLALFTRAATIFEIPVVLLFLFIYKRFSLFKDKYFWYSLITAFLVFLPNLIFIYAKYGGNPIVKFLGLDAGRFGSASGAPHFALAIQWGWYFLRSLEWPIMIPTILGAYIFFEMFIGLDLLFKKKEEAKKILPHILLFLWILIPYSYHTLYAGATFDERYLFYIYPAVFILTGHGLMLMSKWITKLSSSKYIKYVPLVLIILLLSIGCYKQIQKGDDLIQSKASSYYPVKLAGLWIKENSDPTDIIISGSRYQNIYYSERDTYNFALEGYVDKDFIKKQSELQNISRETHGYLTEEAFDEQLKKLKPRFMTVSIFETHPPWAYTYAERHPNVRTVQAYFLDAEKQNLALIIYEFTGYDNRVTIPEPSVTIN